ncbi:STM3941 family protein [Mucilaginibacter sp.]|uniref:STM3941 family protein n=1 Tax=Mucilaginibacter sp. TaxID=1882438 RepID=UPI0025D07978|nr:STM3941 family protein [Mucilaginibacter sp.]
MNIFAIIVAIFFAIMNFISPIAKHGLSHYLYIGWLLIAIARFLIYRKYIYFGVKNKAVLTVDEICIYDMIKNTKYYWSDIKEVYEKNAYLYITLYNPVEYLNNFHSPIKKYFAKRRINSKKRTPYYINIDVVNVNPNVLLELLDDYSIEAAQ